jgi:HSP90 family molecular chaperone
MADDPRVWVRELQHRQQFTEGEALSRSVEASEVVVSLVAALVQATDEADADARAVEASDVRATSRLVDSPACLVVQDGDMSTQLARMLKQAGQAVPEVKPILEINAEHPLVKKLVESSNFDDLAHIIFDQALLAEGGMPADPAAYVKRVNALLV